MLSTDYDSYEPDQGKQLPVTPRIMAWYAGAPSEALAVMDQLHGKVDHNATVAEVAELAATYLATQRLRRARQAVAGSQGIGPNDPISSKMRQQIAEFSINTTLLVGGAEQRRASVYVVDEHGHAVDHSLFGFAAIGSGDFLATHHMHRIAYAAHAPLAEAMLAVYFAKRSAEATPTVGRELDLFILSPRGPVLYASPIRPGMEEAYQEWRATEKAGREKAVAELSEFLEHKAGEQPVLILGDKPISGPTPP